MKVFFKRHRLEIVGALVGALGGYLYYYYVGCMNGTCALTADPRTMMIYGALVGYFLFKLFSGGGKPKKAAEVSNNNFKE